LDSEKELQLQGEGTLSEDELEDKSWGILCLAGAATKAQ